MSDEAKTAIDWRDLRKSGLLSQFLVLCFGVWLHAASSMLAATTLPSAVDELGRADLISWAFTLYQLGSILAGAAAGLMVRRMGLRRGLIGAALVYGFGSAVCAAAPIMQMVLSGRLLQGAGGGMLIALTYVALRRRFPAHLMPRFMALISAVWSTSAFCGPLVGGTFSTFGLWRFGFWAFAVQSIIFVVLALHVLTSDEEPQETAPAHFPVLRLSILTTAIVLVGLAGASIHMAISVLLCLAGVYLIWLFLRVDLSRPGSRMFPSGALKFSETAGAGLAMVACAATATMSFLVYGTILLEELYGVTPVVAGYIIVVESVAWGLAAIWFSGYSPSAEKWLIRTGTALITLGVVGFAYAMPSGQLWLVVACASAQGAGFGMMWGYVIRRMIGAAPDAEKDVTSTAIPTTQQIGFAVGAAASGIVANAAGFADGVSTQSAQSVAFWVFVAFVPLALFANVAAWRLLTERN